MLKEEKTKSEKELADPSAPSEGGTETPTAETPAGESPSSDGVKDSEGNTSVVPKDEKKAATVEMKKSKKQQKNFKIEKPDQKTLKPGDRVQISRRNDRPVAGHYIEALFQDFIELHGDRYFADDPAIVGGINSRKSSDSHCPGEGTEYKREYRTQFWYAVTGRLPEGIASYEAGRKIPPPGHLLRRYAGELLRNFRRRARPGRGDCKKSV